VIEPPSVIELVEIPTPDLGKLDHRISLNSRTL
jgi:hypothetical protein